MIIEGSWISITAILILVAALGAFAGWVVARLQHKRSLAESTLAFQQRRSSDRRDAANRSRHVIKGQISEQLAPFMPDFPFNASDARFLGSPIDYVVFDGLRDVQNRVRDTLRGVVLVEIKAGPTTGLTRTERLIRDCVERGDVTWLTIRIKVPELPESNSIENPADE